MRPDHPRESRRASAVAVMVLATGGPLDAQTAVDGNVLTSTGFPPVVMEFAESLDYVGAREFVLHGVANATIHLFAETEDGRVSRFYWIQFEGYLPDVERTYDYSDSEGRALTDLRIDETATGGG